MKIDVTEELLANLEEHALAASEGTTEPDAERLKLRAAIRVAQFTHRASPVVAAHVYESAIHIEHADGSAQSLSPMFGTLSKAVDEQPEPLDEAPIEESTQS